MEVGALASMDVYFESQRQRFDLYSERGGDWEEHAESTQKRRGAGAPLLVSQGDLRQSLDRAGAAHVIQVTEDGVTEGTANPVARFHQDGTPKMPQRKILDDPEPETVADMKAPLVEGTRGAVRQAASR